GQRKNSFIAVCNPYEGTPKGGPFRSQDPSACHLVRSGGFFRYFDHFCNPSGVQRVSFEICRAATTLDGLSERVRFCRLSIYSKRLHTVDFGEIRSVYLNPPGSIAPWKTFWEPAIFLENFPRSFPVVMRHPRFFFSISKGSARDLIGTWLRTNPFDE